MSTNSGDELGLRHLQQETRRRCMITATSTTVDELHKQGHRPPCQHCNCGASTVFFCHNPSTCRCTTTGVSTVSKNSTCHKKQQAGQRPCPEMYCLDHTMSLYARACERPYRAPAGIHRERSAKGENISKTRNSMPLPRTTTSAATPAGNRREHSSVTTRRNEARFDLRNRVYPIT